MKELNEAIKETRLNVWNQRKPCKVQSEILEAKSKQVLALYPQAEVFAKAMNLDECSNKYSAFKTPKEALYARKIKLNELASIYGEKAIVGWVSTWLISLARLMDVKISDRLRSTVARDLLEDLYMLNIAEWTLFFKRIRKGHYGVFYGKLNMQTVAIAAREYRRERGQVVQKLTASEQQKLGLL